MSDIYVELVSRIPVVAQKTEIGAARLQQAQAQVGLSNEAVARRVPVSEKTWRRWKEAGVIPTAALPAVASALRLELRELAPPEPEPTLSDDVGEVAELRRAVEEVLRRIEADRKETRKQLAQIRDLLERRLSA